MSAKQKGPGWDEPPGKRKRKVSSHAKLKNLPAEVQAGLWEMLHPLDSLATPALSCEEVMVHLLNEHGVSCSSSTFSEWHAWYELERRMEHAEERATQARLRAVERLGLNNKEADAFAALVFKMEALEKRDPDSWAAIKKAEQADEKLEQGKEKLAQGKAKLGQDDRRIALLERKAKAADEAAEELKKLKAGGPSMPEAERTAILDKMDQILGLKK